MDKEYFLNNINKNYDTNSGKLVFNQINKFYDCLKNYNFQKHGYKVGDHVYLKQGTLLHGTFRNIDGLKDISSKGLIASWFIDGRISKYPSCVSVWKLKKDYLLKDYINFYSGGTIKYSGLLKDDEYSQEIKTCVIPYNELNNINNIIFDNQCRIWNMEQTKEARFMPSLAQDVVQIGIIFDNNNEFLDEIIDGDILDLDMFDDQIVKNFVNEKYYDRFIVERKNKDDFFTDRESAILFGVPSNLITGILVGRKYENDQNMLERIKELCPNCYICNLDGKVIVE